MSAGANVKAALRMLGHALAAMTLMLADLFDEDFESVATALDDARRDAGVGTAAQEAVGSLWGASHSPTYRKMTKTRRSGDRELSLSVPPQGLELDIEGLTDIREIAEDATDQDEPCLLKLSGSQEIAACRKKLWGSRGGLNPKDRLIGSVTRPSPVSTASKLRPLQHTRRSSESMTDQGRDVVPSATAHILAARFRVDAGSAGDAHLGDEGGHMGWIAKLLGRQPVAGEVGHGAAGEVDVARPADRDSRVVAPRSATYAVIDVETTGLSPSVDRVIEIAIVKLDVDGGVVDEWVSRFNPEGPVGATHIHGITQSDVDGAPKFRDHARQIERMLSDVTIVGHNVRFDLGFVHEEMQRAGLSLHVRAAVCTLGESVERLPMLPRRRLADCCEAVGVAVVQAHSALGDARAAGALFRVFLAEGPFLAQQIQSKPAIARNRMVALPAAQRAHVQRRIEAHARQEAREELTRLLDSVHLADVVDEGADEGDLAYLEVLAEVLQDGVITAAEQATLADVAGLYSLDQPRIAVAHRAFVVAMARLALLDLRVTREERAEIMRIAEVLAVDSTDVIRVLTEAEISRWTLLSTGLRPLPEDWAHGEPLRVGDKIAFTGCDEDLRESLEAQAQALGVRVINSVSARTVLLVTDGMFRGTKTDAAARFGTRTVLPAELAVLLSHLQPYSASAGGARREAEPRSVPKAQAITRPESKVGSPAQIRAWAARAGYPVGARGRIPADVTQAYANAHEPAGRP